MKAGDTVRWAWGQGHATGTVTATYARKVTRTLKGAEVTRNGSEDDPALAIEQQDGGIVLKLASEVERA